MASSRCGVFRVTAAGTAAAAAAFGTRSSSRRGRHREASVEARQNCHGGLRGPVVAAWTGGSSEHRGHRPDRRSRPHHVAAGQRAQPDAPSPRRQRVPAAHRSRRCGPVSRRQDVGGRGGCGLASGRTACQSSPPHALRQWRRARDPELPGHGAEMRHEIRGIAARCRTSVSSTARGTSPSCRTRHAMATRSPRASACPCTSTISNSATASPTAFQGASRCLHVSGG